VTTKVVIGPLKVNDAVSTGKVIYHQMGKECVSKDMTERSHWLIVTQWHNLVTVRV
jgi:hypothetical protein